MGTQFYQKLYVNHDIIVTDIIYPIVRFTLHICIQTFLHVFDRANIAQCIDLFLMYLDSSVVVYAELW